MIKITFLDVRSYIIITLGLLIYCFGWTAFLIPSGIVAGGVGGIGTMIYYATDGSIPVGYSFFVINCFLVLFGIKILGPKFGAKTVYGIFVASIFLSVQQSLITEPLVDDKFMAAIVGGILSGVGVGITFSQGGSTGGTDIIAMIVNKYKNISPGRIILYIDIFIIASSYLIFEDIPTIVYGYVMMGISTYSIDMMITGSKQSAQLFINSKKHDEIAQEISNEIGRGITMLDASGWYSKEKTQIVMVVVRKHESRRVFKIVKRIDPDAFISMGSVMGVFGLGFDEIRA